MSGNVQDLNNSNKLNQQTHNCMKMQEKIVTNFVNPIQK